MGIIPISRHVTIIRKYLKSIADRIEHGANIDDQDYRSENVQLHYAVSFPHMRISKLQIENGVEHFQTDDPDHLSWLHVQFYQQLTLSISLLLSHV